MATNSEITLPFQKALFQIIYRPTLLNFALHFLKRSQQPLLANPQNTSYILDASDIYSA